MRRKLPPEEKRKCIIGIKVTEEFKEQLKYLAEREAQPLSTYTYKILSNYVQEYTRKNKIDLNFERNEDTNG